MSLARPVEDMRPPGTLLMLGVGCPGAPERAGQIGRGREYRAGGVDPAGEPRRYFLDYGVMEREPYQEPGARQRSAYRVTPAGSELRVVLHALQQWGDRYLPRPEGPSALRRIRGTDLPVHVGYLDDHGHEVALTDVAVIPADPPASAKVSRATSTRL